MGFGRENPSFPGTEERRAAQPPRGLAHLPGDNQLRLAASTAADVGWGDLGDCRGQDTGHVRGRRADEGQGAAWPGDSLPTGTGGHACL